MTRDTQGVVSNVKKKVYYFKVCQFQDTTKFALVKHLFSHFYPENDSIRILTLHSKQPISYNTQERWSSVFAILPSKVNTSVKNKIFFKYIPSLKTDVCMFRKPLKIHSQNFILIG